jgi:hypothetical protein
VWRIVIARGISELRFRIALETAFHSREEFVGIGAVDDAVIE